jgi:hypothetical protein
MVPRLPASLRRRSGHRRLRMVPAPLSTSPDPVVVRVDFPRRARVDASADPPVRRAALRVVR